MSHLICYDISKNNLRAKCGKKIIESGLDRINKSVYLGTISDSSLKKLESELAQLLQKGMPQDSLIILPITISSVQQMRIYGRNDLDKEELTGEKDTIIL